MKKSLIAIAALGAFSGAAFAADSVQLYGTIDLAATHASYSNGGTSGTGLISSSWNASKIGIKGSEDLGGGLTAAFQVETGFCANGGGPGYGATSGSTDQYCTGGTFMGRTSMVSLSGGFGSVSAGRMYTFSDDTVGTIDPTANSGYGAAGTLLPADYTFRQSQMLAYTSPSFGGVTFNAGYMFGNGAPFANPVAKTTGGYNLNVTYAAGPIVAGLDYLRQDDTVGGVAGTAVKSTMAFGSYDFGIAKVGGLYAVNKPDAGFGPFYAGDKIKNWMLGVSAPIGQGSVMLNYTALKDDADSSKNAGLWNLAYNYNLSKRTMVYAQYARLKNNANGTTPFVYAYTPADYSTAAPGFTATAFGVGISHSF